MLNTLNTHTHTVYEHTYAPLSAGLKATMKKKTVDMKFCQDRCLKSLVAHEAWTEH